MKTVYLPVVALVLMNSPAVAADNLEPVRYAIALHGARVATG